MATPEFRREAHLLADRCLQAADFIASLVWIEEGILEDQATVTLRTPAGECFTVLLGTEEGALVVERAGEWIPATTANVLGLLLSMAMHRLAQRREGAQPEFARLVGHLISGTEKVAPAGESPKV